MKKLLNRTLKSFAIYALIVLAVSIPAYYYLVDHIWLTELDEHNQIIAVRTEHELNKIDLTETELNAAIELWNKIQPGTNLTPSLLKARPDSIYTVRRINKYNTPENEDRFRGLSKVILIKDKTYELSIETNVEETEETVTAIAILTLFFFLLLVVGFLILNRRLSARLWKPFRTTLSGLKTFNLNKQQSISFEQSDTLEFEELNAALGKLLEKNIAVYQSQKQFTENASHELQTPLAIIKNKLDMLLQNDAITEQQYGLIEDIHKAVGRITRTNKNLLLLAKIENNQFAENEQINMSSQINKSAEELQEYFADRKINIQKNIADNIFVKGNKVLVEIMLNNLLLNAIRHNQGNDSIVIILDKKELKIANPGDAALPSGELFQRFSRFSQTNSGSGLGLAIIKEITHRHNWSIEYRYTEQYHSFIIYF